MSPSLILTGIAVAILGGKTAAAQEATDRFQLTDVFELEYASDPQIAPDGSTVVYVRNFMDIQTDRRRSNLWIVASDGTQHRPLTTGDENDTSPRFEPREGNRVCYVSSQDGSSQLYVRWLDTGQVAKITHLTEAPQSVVWDPRGRSIAFTMFVEDEAKPFTELPEAPEGAEWAEAPKVITELGYRADGEGYLRQGHVQLFVVPADGGTPRQLTFGPHDVEGAPSWAPDGKTLYFASNQRSDRDLEPLDTEIFAVPFQGGEPVKLTDRRGPDHNPTVSPDGEWIAYLGFDDAHQGYQPTHVYVMRIDGSESHILTGDLERSFSDPVWTLEGRQIYVQSDHHGSTQICSLSLESEFVQWLTGIGGTSLGRPYPGGSFTAAADGRVAYTGTTPRRPADVYLAIPAQDPARLTDLNSDLLGFKELATVEEHWTPAPGEDAMQVQFWVMKPPGFDPTRKYPMVLEIHGGPFLNYGPRFAAELQLYAAAGYVVVYANPRGSTSYSQAFGNAIHHAYPGVDFDDLMVVVQAVIGQGYVDSDNLFVTGGSGGGVLTSWIVGKTDIFRAAVVAKPVINWTSFVLTADAYSFFTKYWFPSAPWEDPEHYFARSPLSLVGNVTTPTMLLTGEEDYRTPISETEQFYQALKLREIDTAMVRVPGAGHGIASRPSHLIAKVAYILQWFENYRVEPGHTGSSAAPAPSETESADVDGADGESQAGN